MKNKTKGIFIIMILIALLLAWSPWITEEYALNKAKANSNFIKQHEPYGGINDSDISLFWLPFGKGVVTYEGLWYITFLGFVI